MPNKNPQQPRRVKLQGTYTEISGPVPPPQILQHYNDVIPDAAERIMRMAEKQSNHRIELEGRVIKSDIIKSYTGMFLATTIAIYGLYIAKEIAINGNPWAAGIIAALDLGGLISVAIYNGAIQKKERDERRTSSSIPPTPHQN